MNYEALNNAIRKRFGEIFTEDFPIAWDNRKAFDVTTLGADKVWVRFTIQHGMANQVSIGTRTKRRFRKLGNAIVQIFGPLDKGDGPLLEMADKVIAQFRSVTAESVLYRTPYISFNGRNEGEWQINVTIPFQHDDFG